MARIIVGTEKVEIPSERGLPGRVQKFIQVTGRPFKSPGEVKEYVNIKDTSQLQAFLDKLGLKGFRPDPSHTSLNIVPVSV
jgi:hypothetical protein